MAVAIEEGIKFLSKQNIALLIEKGLFVQAKAGKYR
jgi:hypothetical protein